MYSLNVTHKGRKYLTIIEHVFHCITHFSCQILSFIHAFVLYMNGLRVDADYISKLFFSPETFDKLLEGLVLWYLTPI